MLKRLHKFFPFLFALTLAVGVVSLSTAHAQERGEIDRNFQVIVDGQNVALDKLTVEINQRPANVSEIAELVGYREQVEAQRIVRVVNGKEILLRGATAVLSANRLQVNGISNMLPKTAGLCCITIDFGNGIVITICWPCCCNDGDPTPTPTPAPVIPLECQPYINSPDYDVVYVNSSGSYVGTSSNEVIIGTDGNDNIDGRNGNDIICGGDGNDKLEGGRGNDKIYGGNGKDSIKGNYDRDELYGGNDDDYIDGGWGADKIEGGRGNDTLKGNNDDDVLKGDDGNDKIYGNKGRDDLYGGNGDDMMYGGRGRDNLHGGNGDDIMHGNQRRDYISGDGGNNDKGYGGWGNDTCSSSTEYTNSC